MTIREDILRFRLGSDPADVQRELSAIARLVLALSRAGYIGHMPGLPCVVCDTVDAPGEVPSGKDVVPLCGKHYATFLEARR
jgi:hypothetical protein